VVTRHEAPRNIVAIHDVEEFFEVVLPKQRLLLRLVVHLARDEVAGNSHEIRLLLPNYLLNHLNGFVIALLVLSKVQVCQLHDAQLPLAVDLEMHTPLTVFVVPLVSATAHVFLIISDAGRDVEVAE